MVLNSSYAFWVIHWITSPSFNHDSIFREHENYLKLDLKYDGPHKFSGIGTHLGSGETFEIIEGEVNKRTKYWKFIALYENSLKKVKGKMNEKRLVQVLFQCI